jgi:prepilin-type N-terminal cleavage/methylation domain-containing protein
MNRSGFTLLEIILATAIAALISVMLIIMLQQMNNTLARVDRTSDIHMRASLLQNQMERDITGAFAPMDFSATATTGEPKPGRPKKIEKIFWGDGKLDMLSFITNNPLQSYWGKRSGKAQPRIVRVVYRLIADIKQPQSYTLMRQEGSSLDLSAYTADNSSIRSYTMVEGIKNIEIEYTTLIKKEQQKEEARPAQNQQAPGKTEEKAPTSPEKTEEKPEEFERKTVKEWKENALNQKPPWPLVPQFVTMKVTLWDDTFKRSRPFTFEFQIIPRFEEADVKEEQEQKPAGFGIGSFLQ